jgi:glucokinase-like ROK family protein
VQYTNSEFSGFLSRTPSLRAINRARIISLIRKQPGLTRSEISEISRLSKGTVSTVVAELLSEKFLWEEDRFTRSQRNTRLRVNPKAGVAVGIELSADQCWAVLTDAEIHPVKHLQRTLASVHVEETVETLSSIIGELLSGVDERCLGVAIAIAGTIDTAGQMLKYSENLQWSDVPLASLLSGAVGYPVTLINRSRAGVLGEHWYGAGAGLEDIIYVSISSGIGAGILIGGHLFTGSNDAGGELGHTTVLPDGPLCVCGNQGCLETLASMPAIIRLIQNRIEDGEPSSVQRREDGSLSYQAVLAAARDGDNLVLEEIKKAARTIGIAVANLVDLFNPQAVIIGGRLSEAGEVVVNIVRETVQRRSFHVSFSGVQILRNALEADSACIGACALVVNQYMAQVEPILA